MKRRALLTLLVALAVLLLLDMQYPTPGYEMLSGGGVALATKGTSTPAPTGVPGSPYPGAPLCAVPGLTVWHSLWNTALGCHYDHEHGDDPGTIQGIFGIDYLQFTGSQVSYPWETANENANKHGGYKWTVRATNEDPCVAGDTGSNGTNGYAVEFHAKGDGAEFSGPTHSSFVIVRICNATQSGLLVTGGWQSFGQRESPYQGVVVNFPNQPQPPIQTGLAPYWSLDCYNDGPAPDCGAKTNKSTATFVSRPQEIAGGHAFAQILARARDLYQWVIGSSRLNTPIFRWVCGNQSYNPVGCPANNTTATVHQVFGNIPASFDPDGDGVADYSGYTDRWGNLVNGCTATSLDCIPLLVLHAPVGEFSTTFDNLLTAFSTAALPERDVYFCQGQPCAEGAPGAVASGWLGPNN